MVQARRVRWFATVDLRTIPVCRVEPPSPPEATSTAYELPAHNCSRECGRTRAQAISLILSIEAGPRRFHVKDYATSEVIRIVCYRGRPLPNRCG